MYVKHFFWMMALFFVTVSCSEETQPAPVTIQNPTAGTGNSGNNPARWLIPIEEVRDGGPGKDGIPSIDNPVFQPVSIAANVPDDALIVGVKSGDEVRAYPHYILDWHEIVNDDLGMLSVAVTYCPLTGTAIGWDREVNGENTTFGVSGLLFNSNLMPYDRLTNSTWSQMRLDCVNGSLIETKVNTIHVVETTWKTWRAMYPNSVVLTEETGFARSYGVYPYGEYQTSRVLIFPVDYEGKGLHPKDRVLGVEMNTVSKVYPLDLFEGEKTKVIQDTISGVPVVVVGNKALNFMVAYENSLEGEPLTFTATDNNIEGAVMKDEHGNVWNIFGEVINGPDQSKKLPNLSSYIAFWFAWSAFHPDAVVYEEE